MATSKIEKVSWQKYLDSMSKAIGLKNAEIEIEALSIGSQVEAEWLPLLGISYDPKDDAIDIILEGFDHRISQPRELHVDQLGIELRSLDVVDDDGVSHIIKLRAPLLLSTS